MELTGDLSTEALAGLLPGRPLRCYPALLSTEAEAQAWARAGAPAGAVVTAEYQASPRGRGGLEWHPEPGRSLAFSIVLRPGLPAAREGWLYPVSTSALADAGDGEIEWPDAVPGVGAVGVHAELGPAAVDWAVVNVLLEEAQPPRGPLLARVVEAIETRLAEPSARVLADYLPRCATIGRSLRARLVPMGPSGVQVSGVARTVLTDGALVLEQEDGRRIAVRPQGLGVLEPLP